MTDLAQPLRVLLVEDSADDAEIIARTLRAGGLVIEARVVDTAAGLRAELPAFSPDVVLADWGLPGFSGAEAVAIAHEWDPAVPCILVSGTLGEELVVQALRTGATDYVLKQRLEALVPAVRRALDEAVARRENGRLEAELAASQATMRGSLDAMADPFVVCKAVRGPDGSITGFRVEFANQAAGAFMGVDPEGIMRHPFTRSMADARGDDVFDICRAVVESRQPHAVDGLCVGGAHAADSPDRMYVDATIGPFNDGFFLVFRDVTQRLAVARERDRLAAIVADSIDGITITGPQGEVVYANPAFQALIGLELPEIIGQPMPTIVRGAIDAATIAEIDAAARSGRRWAGEVNHDLVGGTTRRTELAVIPRRDADGTIADIVTVFHDVTDLREAQADLALQATIRLRLADALRALREDATLEQAAQTICDELVELPYVDQASVDVFLGPADLQIIGLSAPAGFPLAVGDRLPAERAALIRERLASGPWAWFSTDDPIDTDWSRRAMAAGLRATAYGPIVHGDQLVGALVLGTFNERFARTLVEKMPGVVSFSATSSALLAGRLQGLRRAEELRASLRTVLASRSFHAVFQPIVDLASGGVVGYEALSRFDSGQRPDLCFADAWSVGLGADLELATLGAAVAAGRQLPPGLWLSLNVSPAMLAAPERLRAVLRGAHRPLVIEITEHSPIEDYAVVRDAVRALGHNARLAVDDAGAGVANFSHIIELHPDFVKLDIGLVRRVDADLGRQAMVVGMQHFSRSAGCRLIAEGIEADEEAATLLRLGVDFGQGYLFGRPDLAGVWTSAPTVGGEPIPITRPRVVRTGPRREREATAAAPDPIKLRGSRFE